ncbi:LamG-like jellyroll fold domain-containing protein [Parafrankia elaeagni]|uniref:LamG-like jellyroll fold domain-containing protein n=1 Tax=Parafrankia elaeagni TaxID=222534 RepID=UPI0003821290|nr:LamG-like jellyroll fold domain-containing protein [Parafrankia elaeagni]
MASSDLTKIYSDRNYVHTTLARHQGVLLGFAMDRDRRIHYTVLNPAPGAGNGLDTAAWSANPLPLPFPTEIAEVGRAIAGTTSLPKVRRGGVEAGATETLRPDEIDPFLSTTARLSAKAAFQVVSDSSYVLVFRQAIAATDPQALYKVADGSASAAPGRAYVKDTAGERVAIVDSTLLCDRFLLVGTELKPVTQVRYRRSRHATRPESAKDSPGTTDMDNRPFLEPTHELTFVGGLVDGAFTVLLLPTQVHDTRRWQIFARNAHTDRVDSLNIEQAPDGLFNTRGTRYYTSPDPAYTHDVLEREPGVCPFTKEALVPVHSTGFGETAVRFDGTDAHASVLAADDLGLDGDAFTLEAWIRPTAYGGCVLSQLDGGCGPFDLGLDNAGGLTLRRGSATDTVTATPSVALDTYTHVAVIVSGDDVTLYRDGIPAAAGTLAGSASTGPLLIGARDVAGTPGDFFTGDIDEIRVWDRARAAGEIAEDARHRLIGNEPGLVAYYRCDEGAGTTLHDQTDNPRNGDLKGSAAWVTSEAPVGDHPGVRRDSFAFTGRTPVAGLAASLYFQQEDTALPGSGQRAPAKRQARVLLAAPTTGPAPDGTTTGRAYLAALDFAVGRDGRLAQVPDQLTLPVVGKPDPTADVSKVSELEEVIEELLDAIAKDREFVRTAATETQRIPAVETDRKAAEAEVARLAARGTRPMPPDCYVIQSLNSSFLKVMLDSMRVGARDVRLISASSVSTGRHGAVWQLVRTGRKSADGRDVHLIYNVERGWPLRVTDSVLAPRDKVGDPAAADLVEPSIHYTPGSPATPYEEFVLEFLPGSSTDFSLVSLWNGNRVALIKIHLPDYREYQGVYRTVRPGEAVAEGSTVFRLHYVSAVTESERARRESAQQAEQAELDSARRRLDDLAKELARLHDIQPQLAAKRAELAAAEARLSDTRNELARLTGGLRGSDDVTLPMRHLHTDRTGLSVAGGLLAFAWSAHTPFLFDSATGDLTLYFRGGDGQFFATYYDTDVLRSVKQLAAGTSLIQFRGRDPLTDLDDVKITISDHGQVPTRCTVEIRRGSHTETFKAVPRAFKDFATVLNGTSKAASSQVGKVSAATGKVITLAEETPRTVPAGACLTVGSAVFLTDTETPSGSATLTLTSPAENLVTVDEEVNEVLYDYSLASATRPGVSVTKGSQIVQTVTDGTDGEVGNGTATDLQKGHGCRWRGESPGRALGFAARDSQYLSLDSTRLGDAAAPGDITVEAWVNPDEAPANSRLITASIPASAAATATASAGDTRFTLGLEPAPRSDALAFGGNALANLSSVDLGATDFTIEFWAKRQETGVRVDPVMVQLTSTRRDMMVIGWLGDARFSFAFGADALTTASAYPDLSWHHWAVTYDRATAERNIYRDGFLVASGRASTPDLEPGFLLLGYAVHLQTYSRIGVDEVRIWNRVRSQDEVMLDRRRRLSGREPWLLRYWKYTEGALPELTRKGSNGSLSGQVPATESPISEFRFFAGFGDRLVRTQGVLPCGEWNHLAASFEQSWAVHTAGRGHLDAGTDNGLNLTGDLTIEMFLRLDSLTDVQGLISRGTPGDGAGGAVPYHLVVLPQGTLVLSFETADGTRKSIASNAAIKAGTFHRIAVSRRLVNGTEQRNETRTVGGTTVNVVNSVPTAGYYEIVFYVDGSQVGRSRADTVEVGGNAAPVEIGRVRDGSLTYPMRGTLAEVRLWNVARDPARMCGPVTASDRGLVAHWRFAENAGTVTTDAGGLYRAQLHDMTWVTSPDPDGARLTVYRNGTALKTDTVSQTDALRTDGYGERQLTVGGRMVGGALRNAFDGTLEELRIWRTARTREQILDNMFGRLKGERESLVACYSFDADSTVATATEVRDSGLRGCHLTLPTGGPRPTSVLSTAPVSTDTAQVRSALTGVRNQFHEHIDGPPAVAEYADTQVDARGLISGVMKRCYSYPRDGRWHLVTGYKVGNLYSEWVSQAQFDPQIVGYVEGAPPIPSENLTSTSGVFGSGTFDDATKVEVARAEEVVHTQSSSTERSRNLGFGLSRSLGVEGEIENILAPLGLGVSIPVQLSATLNRESQYEFGNASTNESSVEKGEKVGRDTTVGLRGGWEDPDRLLNTTIGRRWMPSNVGFALVRSSTADIYALRLTHNKALVAYHMMPSPDVPEDWNLIQFPINPRYTKQGTLDGTVGFSDKGKVLDPDYPQAAGRGEYSYFKPDEAYALKRRIEHNRQRLRSYYQSLSTQPPDILRSFGEGLGATMKQFGIEAGLTLGAAAIPFVGPFLGIAAGAGAGVLSVLNPHLDDITLPDDTRLVDGFSRRDLVNTYIWSADGGFLTETTETTDAVSETTSGTFTATRTEKIGLEVGAEVIISADLGLNLTGSMGYTSTRTATKTSTKTFSLNVTYGYNAALWKVTKDGNRVTDATGAGKRQEGKVDAYRFMTFYLDSDSANFEDFYGKVVDPTWIRESTDPNAVALRQARQSTKKPPCWRVMHRVTYVSRVLPAVPPASAPPLEKAMRKADFASDAELIARLTPYVRDATADWDELQAATAEAVRLHLPELVPHTKAITELFARYFGVSDDS